MDILETYIDLEQIRFKDIDISISFDESLDFLLPPYTLQPLVENAIHHGIRKIVGLGKVEVIIQKLNDVIRIEVIDNGIGIKVNKLQNIQENLKCERYLEADHALMNIGLYNVSFRLLNLLETTLQIESEYQEGTKVFFEIKQADC